VRNLLSGQPYLPTTFQERGAAVPFTTPVLGGTRVRAGRKTRVELTFRNPADGRGVYVTPWTDIALRCRPTLHDRVLITKIAALPSLTPTTIRQAARTTAEEGLAGEPAMEAARAATAKDKEIRAIASHRLLVALIHQVNAVPDLQHASLEAGTDDLDTQARLTNDWLASHLGQPRTWAATALEAIADIMSGSGELDRIPRQIAMLRQTRDEIAGWGREQWRVDWISCADMISSAAEFTLTLAASALAKERLATENMIGLLRTWAIDPDVVIRFAARPEWLLDGWEQICLIWNFARDDAGKCAALVEIIEQVPIMPKAVSEWAGNTSDLVVHRPISLNVDSRNGASVHDLIARNEQFRALAP
jgi:hypothetical protein